MSYVKTRLIAISFLNHVLESTKIFTTSKVDKTFIIKRKRENRNGEKERKREKIENERKGGKERK